MAQFIDSAQHRLDIQHPKYVDVAILDRIAEAAERGVRVHVLCGGRHGISDWDVMEAVFDSDWEQSHHYVPPDPLDPSQHHEDDFPHDHDLLHE